MSETTLCTRPLKDRMLQLRHTLGVSWRQMPIRLGVDRHALDAIRFSDQLDAASALQVARRIGEEPSALWPELATVTR